jgi:hypothetical protein
VDHCCEIYAFFLLKDFQNVIRLKEIASEITERLDNTAAEDFSCPIYS